MNKFILPLVGIAVVVVGGWIYFSHYSNVSTAPYVVPPLTETYTNDTYGFSLTMPEDFEASVVAEEGSDTLLLQDKNGNGIQIVVSPFDEDMNGGYTLTEERIRQDMPDMKMSDMQSVEVGEEYQGVAFKSDNENFGGASREVWFVFHSNLYQISTYERLDELLKQIFATWQFH